MRGGFLFEKHKFIIIWSPKCACTTVKNICCQLLNIDSDSYMGVHSINFININIKNILEKYPDYPVIYFTRNPYHRIISGYTKFTDGLIKKLNFHKNKNLKENNKLTKNGSLSFDEYLDLILSSEPSNLNDHFQPQTLDREKIFQHKNLTLYDIDKLSDFQSFLKDKLNIDIQLDIHSKYGGKRASLPENKLDSIHKFFHNDFELLGYNKEFN
jgi:hypothetical protein